MKKLLKNTCLFLVILMLGCPAGVFAVEDAMDMFPLAPGTKMFNFYYNRVTADTLYSNGSKADEDFNEEGYIGLFRGAAWYNVGGYTALSAVFVPFGTMSIDATVPAAVDMQSPSGLGDIMIYNGFWVINNGKKGLFVEPDLMVTAPTGEYDNEKAVNLASNRWAFKPGVNVAKVLTSKGTFAQAKIAAEFYTKNDEYLGAKFELEKEPLYSFQGYVTQFLNPKTFMSLDYFFDYGGETKVEGVKQDDKTKTHSVQFTVSRTISEGVDFMIKYRKDVSVENGAKADTLGIRLTYLFPAPGKN